MPDSPDGSFVAESPDESLTSDGPHVRDPVTGNPFPPNRPLHLAWENATRIAEKKLLLLRKDALELFAFIAQTIRSRAEVIEKAEREGKPLYVADIQSFNGAVDGGKEARRRRNFDFLVAIFDIWANRGLVSVENYETARAYERWLEEYSNNLLNAIAHTKRSSQNDPADLRATFSRRVVHYSLLSREKLETAGGLLPNAPDEHTKSTAPTSKRIVDESHGYHVGLFRQVIAKTGKMATWLAENRPISRTAATDYVGGRIKGHMSEEKRKQVETAIVDSANRLGLPTRTDPD